MLINIFNLGRVRFTFSIHLCFVIGVIIRNYFELEDGKSNPNFCLKILGGEDQCLASRKKYSTL